MSTLSFKALLLLVPEIRDVEDLVRSKFISESKPLSDIPQYLFNLGGKRIRPLLALLLGKALKLSPIPQPLIEISAGIELIHLATLLHDDIIDKSQKRRNATSPYAAFGISPTLLSGDFLLVRAFSLCAHLDPYIIEKTEIACIELTEGEIDEIPLSEQQATLAMSLEISRKKTASLFRLAAESAGFIAGLSQERIAHLSAFGERLGVSFQVLDDILDVTSSDDVLGKPVGTDIREKKPTAVNTLWLESGDPASEILLSPETPGDNDIQKALTHLRTSKIIKETKKVAHHELTTATQELSHALEGKVPEYLSQLIQLVVERMS